MKKEKKKPISIKSRKQKGRNLQNKIRDVFIKRYNLHPDRVRGRIMGESGCDIVDYTGLIPLSIECKNTEKINIWDAIEQARKNVRNQSEKIPVVIFKRNNSEIYITLPWNDFLGKFLDHYMEDEGLNVNRIDTKSNK